MIKRMYYTKMSVSQYSPPPFLYEPTAELQLTEYGIVHVWKLRIQNCFGVGGKVCEANGKPTITVFGGNQLPV